MKCPKCEFENPNESSYCMNCGTRLDGKIQCPNCRSLVDPNANNCPNCGAKLPKERAVEDSERYNRFKINRANRNSVWQIVFTAVFMGLLLLSLIGAFTQIISNPNDTNPDLFFKGSGLFYLTFEWGDAIKKVASTSDGVYKFNYIFLPIFRAVMVWINVLLTYTFGIIGIVKGIKQLKKKRQCVFSLHYYVAAVLASNVITGACLLSTYSDGVQKVTLASSFDGLMSLYSASIFIAMIYHTYLHFDKDKISLFVQNILFSLGFVLCVTILSNTGTSYLVVDGVKVGILDLFRNYIRYILIEHGDLSLTASICSSVGVAYVFEVIIRCVGFVYLIFFTKGFFLNEETDIKVKLPCYFGSIVIFALSAIIMFITTGVSLFYKFDLLGYAASEITPQLVIDVLKNTYVTVFVGGGVSAMLSCSFVMVGTSMSSFLIVKTYKKNMKIIDARKVSNNN